MGNSSMTWKERCFWIAGVGFLVVVAVVTGWVGGKGNEIVSYVSFAGAITSMFLAAVAIFYSIVHNTSSQQNIGEMRNLLREVTGLVRAGATEMSTSAAAMVKKAHTMEETFTTAFSEKGWLAPAEARARGNQEHGSIVVNTERLSPPLILAMYLFIRAKEEEKGKIPVYTASSVIYNIEDLKENLMWSMLPLVTAIFLMAVEGVELQFMDSPEMIRIQTLPEEFCAMIHAEMRERIKTDEELAAGKKRVDEYIRGLPGGQGDKATEAKKKGNNPEGS